MENLQITVDDDLSPPYSVQSSIEICQFSWNNQNDRTLSPAHILEPSTPDQAIRSTDLYSSENSYLYKQSQIRQSTTQGASFASGTNFEVPCKGSNDLIFGNDRTLDTCTPRSQKPIIVKKQDFKKSTSSSAQDVFWASMLQAQLCVMELEDEICKQEMPEAGETFDLNSGGSKSCLDSSTSIDKEDETREEDLVCSDTKENDEYLCSEEEIEDESLFCDNPLFMVSLPLHPMDDNLQLSHELNNNEKDLISFDEVKCEVATSLCETQPQDLQDQFCFWENKYPGTSTEIGHGFIATEPLEILQIYEDEQEESNAFNNMRSKKWPAAENIPCIQKSVFHNEDSQLSVTDCNSVQKESEVAPGTMNPHADKGLLFSTNNFNLVSALLEEDDSGITILPPQISTDNETAPELPQKTRAHLRETNTHPVCQGCKGPTDETLKDPGVNEVNREADSSQHQNSSEMARETEQAQEVRAEGVSETSSSEDCVANDSGQDLEAARQLAYRLFNLDGFERFQVASYLQKNNEFSAIVAEEYLSLFDFTGKTLDVALRSLMKELVLTGETQERERVLLHFSKRCHNSNPNDFSSSDAVHTLTCALMLLNSDLHGQNIGKCMSLQEFINNLDGMNNGGNFPRELLKGLYHSIRNQKLEWALNDGELTNTLVPKPEKHSIRKKSSPFLDMPAPDINDPIYRRGMLSRKVHADTDGKKTPWGKRSWKAFYTVLKGMLLFFLKDEYRLDFQSPEEVISVHHSLAERASEYTKRPHVFRLQTADWRVFLFQAQTAEEMNSWIVHINLVAAMFSSPPFPAAIGSQKRFVRPILPFTKCKLGLEEQLQSHESLMDAFTDDLTEHQRNLPDQSSKARDWEDYHLREEYLRYEKSRYETYVKLLALCIQNGSEDISSWESLLTEPDGSEQEGCGLKRSHSSPSLNPESSPVVIKVKRNISERRTYRRIIPKRNKYLA
ncbi:PH and SEC7 domain-containing protein 4 [Bombina bombina]|uniref:PH and SEC7 domain-containing protein 4 n=1 Tax=Bombina bombina TaxID=8345 RepID=UPI00235AFA66|nr:PH and SEC7 domain-containing protein 4 [Bombina bombina]XP_053573769.1 PH and SEC7 domain-containing protein 4 [Bombina bombina]XP_053573770.1 PH and SEC7 domain-containing protein 4 [Bombina bombina]